MTGYLAFDGDHCIGWCNATDIRNLRRLAPDVEPYIKDEKIGCTICYVIHPERRRMGVATELLKRAISDFKEAGFDGMLALPTEVEGNKEKEYRGSYMMYEKIGYMDLGRLDGARVMKLSFK
jgi:GNAT superfamily N-acetyltransferase